MKRAQHKKLSGAQGRKRRRAQDKEYAKSSKILTAFLERGKDCEPSTSKSVEDIKGDTSHDSTKILQQEDSEERYSCSESNSREPDLDIMEYRGSSNSGDLDDDLPDPVQPDTAILADVIHHQDVGYIKFDQASGKAIVSDALRIEIVKRGSTCFQNSTGPFAQRKNRSMTSAWFRKQLGKGDSTVWRSWLVYSPVKGAAFCFSCLLFPANDAVVNSSLETENGFKSWKKLEKMTAHEKSQRHRHSFLTWKEMEMRLVNKNGLRDAQLQKQIAEEKERWRQVLERVVSCIKYLAKQNLALGGNRESTSETENWESHRNAGDILGLLKLVADYDPVMKAHLLYAQQDPGSTRYLSPEILNEFIQLLASTVREQLVSDIQRATFYGIMFDSTPEAAGHKQMSETIRYVDINFGRGTVAVKETFLGFIQAPEKDTASIADVILQQLEKDKLPFEVCRSQCYDNASVKAGYKSGVRQRLAALNSKATFVNCDNYTLNLVGVHAVSQEVAGVTFFDTVQAIYVYFSRSTLLWERLKTSLGVSVKSEPVTCWSARVEAVEPIHDQLEHLVELLENIADDQDETSDTRSDANKLLHQILTFEFLVLLRFWNTVLAKIDQVQTRFQDHTMNFHNAAQDIQALQGYFLENTHALCKNSLEEAKELCSTLDVRVERLQRKKKKKMPGEPAAEDAGLTAENEMLRLMESMIDKIHSEMGDRFISLQQLDSSFGFLLDVKELLRTTNENSLKQRCISMGSFYDTDLDGSGLFNDIMICRMLLEDRPDVQLSTPEDLLRFILEYSYDTCPNLRVGLQIVLTVASCGRSFSKLKLIRSYLRSSMGQDLSALALLSVEQEVTNSTNFDGVIETFAAAKARRITI